jgi:predicted ester cyclase
VAQSAASIIRNANSAIFVVGDLDAIGPFFAPDYTVHGTDGNGGGGLDWVRRFVTMVRKAFPDLQLDVEILVEGDGRVAWQRTLRGTQRGVFMGFPATDRPIVWRDMVTSRVEACRIVEDWAITDLPERLLRARKA